MTSLTITATLCSSVHLGAKNTAAYFLSGLDYIPGRSLLGAAAWAWIDEGGNPDGQDFKDRFSSNGVSWGDLLPLPLEKETGAPVAGMPIVAPRTTKACKLFGLRHGHTDTLLLVKAPGDLEECCHSIDGKRCGMGLKRLDRVLVERDDGKRRYSRPHKEHRTHLAIAFETGAARSGYLYSREVLQEGQIFRGTVRCADPALAPMLGADLERLRLSVGSGRSRGYGQLRIEVTKERTPALTAGEVSRASDEIATVRELAVGGHDARYFTLTAGSPWFLREADGGHARSLSGTQLARGLGVTASQVKILTGDVRSEARSGWDGAAGLPIEVRTMVSAGSTFLCSVSDLSDADLAARLDGLAARGMGGHRLEGLGRVIVNHPLHFNLEAERGGKIERP